MNLLHLSGHLTQHPEPKAIGEKLVLNGTLAHNHSYKDRQGERQAEVVFLDFEAWNVLAETMSKYLSTKRKILLSGRLKYKRWEDERGKHSQVLLVAEHFEFMDHAPKPASEVATAST